jgi:opacity protein-like surface antigen
MSLKKYVKIFSYLGVFASFCNCNKANALDYNTAGNYFGGTYDYTLKIRDYDNEFVVDGTPANMSVKNNSGFGAHANYTYIMDNNFFVEAEAGYRKQENKTLLGGAVPGTLTHKMIDGALNLGYAIDLDCAIKPFGSVGFGVARVDTELTFLNPTNPNGFATNSGNTVKDTKPYFNYKLGLQFVTNSAIIEAGYHYMALKDLDGHLDGASLNMVDQDGVSAKADEVQIQPFKNHIHSVSIGVKFPI